MSVDHTKVVYHSGFNAYKNINVYDATVDITGDTITPGEIKEWETVIDVEPDSKFVTMAIQANETTGFPPAPTALRWQSYPSSDTVWGALDTDPDNLGALGIRFTPVISGTKVHLKFTTGNPNINNITFEPISIGVQYAIHTID